MGSTYKKYTLQNGNDQHEIENANYYLKKCDITVESDVTIDSGSLIKFNSGDEFSGDEFKQLLLDISKKLSRYTSTGVELIKTNDDESIQVVREDIVSSIARLLIGNYGFLQDRIVSGDYSDALNYRTCLMHNCYVSSQELNTYRVRSKWTNAFKLEFGNGIVKLCVCPTTSFIDDTYFNDSDFQTLFESSANNTVFSKGALSFSGTSKVWDDIPPNPIIRSRQPATNNPTLATLVGNIQQYTFAVNDYVSDNLEVLHGFENGADKLFHIHWCTNGTTTVPTYVKWQMEISESNVWETFNTTTIIEAQTTITASTPDRTHMVTQFPTVSCVSCTIGTVITYNIKRIAATGTAPTDNPFGLQVSAHMLKDSIGSKNVFSK